MNFYTIKQLLSIIVLLCVLVSCVPSNQTPPIDINEVTTESILNYIDADHFFSQPGLLGKFRPNDPSYFQEAMQTIQLLHDNAVAKDETFPAHIFTWRTGDFLRLDNDLVEALDSNTFHSFFTAPVDEIISTLTSYGLEIRDLTTLYAYDGYTSVADIQTLAIKAMNNVKSGEIPLWAKVQRGTYSNSLTPSEIRFLETIDLDTN